MDWDTYFIEHAKLAAKKSKDRSTQVGAIVVGPDNEIRSTGFNGFPRGVNDDVEYRHERPQKYKFTEHAERNCIFHAALTGQSLKGCILYLNFEPIPCTDCTRAIIQSGITEIAGPDLDFPGKGWSEDMEISKEMLEEAGIKIRRIKEEE